MPRVDCEISTAHGHGLFFCCQAERLLEDIVSVNCNLNIRVCDRNAVEGFEATARIAASGRGQGGAILARSSAQCAIATAAIANEPVRSAV